MGYMSVASATCPWFQASVRTWILGWFFGKEWDDQCARQSKKKNNSIVLQISSVSFHFSCLPRKNMQNQMYLQTDRLNSDADNPVIFRNCAERWATLL